MSLPTYLMSNFPSVRPSLNLQFDSQPTPEDMTSHLASVGATFSRASIGTYTDANGIIQEATSGQARPNYSNAGVHEGLLIEESRTNFAQSSEDLDDTTRWGQNRVTVVEEAIINPKGTASAFKMAETTDNQTHSIIIESAYRPSVTSGTKYTQSYYVKKGDGATAPDIIQIASGADLGSKYQNFNISTDSLLAGNGDDATIEDVGNGWYRISMTATASANGNSSFLLVFTDNADSGRLPSYTGVTTSDIYVWGAQFEEGSFPTSYIPTSGNTATRSADVCYIDGTAFTDFYNEEEGTVYFNGKNPDLGADSSFQRFWYIAKSSTDRVQLQKRSTTNDIQLFVEKNNVSNSIAIGLTAGETFKHATAFYGDDTNTVNFLDGTKQTNISVAQSFSEDLDFMGIGQVNGTSIINSTIKKIIYFPRALSDNELTKLTQ